MKKLEIVFRADNGIEERYYTDVRVFAGARRELNRTIGLLWDEIVEFAKSASSDHIRVTLYDFDTTESLATKRIEPWELYPESWNLTD